MAVLVTRPDERGKALVDQLNQAGVVALHLPLLSIEAGAELAQLPTKLNQLKSGDYVFLVSQSAVDFADKTLKDIGFNWRQDLQYLQLDIERHSIFPVKLNALFVIQLHQKIPKVC